VQIILHKNAKGLQTFDAGVVAVNTGSKAVGTAKLLVILRVLLFPDCKSDPKEAFV